jgi:protein decreased size exclusion limit 1
MRPLSTRRLHPVSAGILGLQFWQAGTQHRLVTQGRDGIIHIWAIHNDWSLGDAPLRTFARDAYSFCRFSLFTISPNVDQGHMSPLDQQRSGTTHSQSPIDELDDTMSENRRRKEDSNIKDRNRADQLHEQAEACIRALHVCRTDTSLDTSHATSLPSALLAIPGNLEREADVCCPNCTAVIACLRQPPLSQPSWGMVMAVQLFLGPALKILAAVGYECGAVVIWDVGSPQQPLAHGKLHNEPIMALSIDAGGFSGVSGSAEDKLISFQVQYDTGMVVTSVSIDLHKQGVGDVALRPDGKLLATAGWDGRVRLYRRETGKALAVLRYHTMAATAVKFSPRRFLLASGARDGTVALYDIYARSC